MLVSTRFQVLFHSPPGVLFTFPSRYCSSIGHQVVFRLGGWSPRLPTGFLVSRGTLDTARITILFRYGALTLCGRPSQTVLLKIVTHIAVPVWPLPRSLATTSGISVDFSSSPYLDVSVQAVPRVRLFDSTHADGVLLRRVSPFGHLRINSYLRLPEAYRSLSRPSSAPDAKAFPLRSYQLDLLSFEKESRQRKL